MEDIKDIVKDKVDKLTYGQGRQLKGFCENAPLSVYICLSNELFKHGYLLKIVKREEKTE